MNFRVWITDVEDLFSDPGFNDSIVELSPMNQEDYLILANMGLKYGFHVVAEPTED